MPLCGIGGIGGMMMDTSTSQQQQQRNPLPGGAMGGGMPPMPQAVAMLRAAPSGAPLRKSQSALELVSWRNTSGDLDFWDPTGHLAEQLHGMQGIKVRLRCRGNEWMDVVRVRLHICALYIF